MADCSRVRSDVCSPSIPPTPHISLLICNFRGYPPVTEASRAVSRSALTMKMSCEGAGLSESTAGEERREGEGEAVKEHPDGSHVTLSPPGNRLRISNSSLSLFLSLPLISSLIISLPPPPLPHSVHSHFPPV